MNNAIRTFSMKKLCMSLLVLSMLFTLPTAVVASGEEAAFLPSDFRPRFKWDVVKRVVQKCNQYINKLDQTHVATLYERGVFEGEQDSFCEKISSDDQYKYCYPDPVILSQVLTESKLPTQSECFAFFNKIGLLSPEDILIRLRAYFTQLYGFLPSGFTEIRDSMPANIRIFLAEYGGTLLRLQYIATQAAAFPPEELSDDLKKELFDTYFRHRKLFTILMYWIGMTIRPARELSPREVYQLRASASRAEVQDSREILRVLRKKAAVEIKKKVLQLVRSGE